ncbi:hypothetical protein HID58_040727 [Brassica napus]|uniref:xyloglucan:xyloglucosyl transferase n=5 Tax=Brassica TaxID=3705 RepID=A0ABQ8B8U8_BRANA|nr:hypothetical protein HID58_040727 [Brassica napus]
MSPFKIFLFSALLAAAFLASTADFNSDVNVAWGNGRGKILNNGQLLTLTLDKSSGSGFQSKTEYLFGKIDMQIKLVPGNSAGTVTTFYLKSEGSTWDEIDFEFLGNMTGDPYTLHTNVYTQGKGDKEQQFHLWFDPTANFHTYSILWNPQRIILTVDDTPIREFKNSESLGVLFPKSKPMRMYASLWNADDWATRGGLVKTDWSKAPFTASYRNIKVDGCAHSNGRSSCTSTKPTSNWYTQEMDSTSQARLRWVQKNYMIYNYYLINFFPGKSTNKSSINPCNFHSPPVKLTVGNPIERMSHNDTVPLYQSSQSDIDEIENMMSEGFQSGPGSVLPARPPSPIRPSIPVTSSPLVQSNLPPLPPAQKVTPVPVPPSGSSGSEGGKAIGFGSPPNTLTEPVWDTVKRDLARIVSNLKLVVFPNPNREDPGKALRDWDLWGPFFFIVFLGLTLSWSASVKKSEVFAVAFALLAAGAVILTLNVLLLGGHIIFFQSLSLLGYCLFPLDVGAVICMLKDNVILKMIVVCVTLAWSSWAAYPFMSAAVNPRRKALALYPVFLMYVSVGFLIIAID